MTGACGLLIINMSGQEKSKVDTETANNKGQKEEGEPKKTFVPWFGEVRPRKGPIIDLQSKIGTKITVQFSTGRVLEGTLLSYDRFFNLLLDDTVESLDGGEKRKLGKVFSRGRIQSIGPTPN